MERLTEYKPTPNSMFPYKLIDGGAFIELDAIHKLGRLEDIEEKIGCSLDIVFDALYRGIIAMPHPFYTHDEIKPKKEYDVVQLFQFYYLKVEDGVVDIKDYGKTWWIKEEDRSEQIMENKEPIKNEGDDYNVYGSKLKDVEKIKELEEENKKLKEIIGDMILKASKHLEEE